jgi:hypothetical protein
MKLEGKNTTPFLLSWIKFDFIHKMTGNELNLQIQDSNFKRG